MELPFGNNNLSDSPAAATSVLVVEDEFIIASSLQRSLQRLGYAVAGVADRGEGLQERIEESMPDIILMDIEINGEQDGIAVASGIQDRYDIPIVYVSGLRHDELLTRIPETRPFGFLAKPFTDHELSVALSIALYKARAERWIRDQEIRIQRLLEHMNQGFCLLDEDGNIRYANRKILDTLGLDMETLKGIHPSTFVRDSEDFFALFRTQRGPRHIPDNFCLEPFTTDIHYGDREIPCYVIPQFFSDPATRQLQGCFLSIINISALESKNRRDVIQ
jgi:PAS domain S-box-containing protein